MLTRTLPGGPRTRFSVKSSPGLDSHIGSQFCLVILKALFESHTDEQTMRERGNSKNYKEKERRKQQEGEETNI